MENFYRACLFIRRRGLIAVLSATCLAPAGLAQQVGQGKVASGANCESASAALGTKLMVAECPTSTVATIVEAGNSLEQNRLGIAAALVLGPKRSISEARKLFEKSARPQR